MAPDVLLTVPELPMRPESAVNVMESLPGAITEPPALTRMRAQDRGDDDVAAGRLDERTRVDVDAVAP